MKVGLGNNVIETTLADVLILAADGALVCKARARQGTTRLSLVLRNDAGEIIGRMRNGTWTDAAPSLETGTDAGIAYARDQDGHTLAAIDYSSRSFPHLRELSTGTLLGAAVRIDPSEQDLTIADKTGPIVVVSRCRFLNPACAVALVDDDNDTGVSGEGVRVSRRQRGGSLIHCELRR